MRTAHGEDMRIKIVIRPVKDKAILNWNYQYMMAGMIYSCLRRGNSRLSKTYHTSTNFKLFTYSWLKGHVDPGKDGLVVRGNVSFQLSSINSEFIQAVFEGSYVGDVVRIGNAEFQILKTSVIREPDFRSKEEWKMKTLSPVLVRTYVEGKDNPHWDLSPDSPMFFSNIRENLIKKFEYVNYHQPDDKRLDFKEIKVFERKRINIKGSWHRAWMLKFVVSGSHELMRIGYQSGFGEKNSMGFGMVEVVK